MSDVEKVTMPEGDEHDAWSEWLATRADEHQLRPQQEELILLAHADDGVIWGRLAGSTLALAGDVFDRMQVKLRAKTLQQLRLFGPAGELLLWRVEDGFTSRVLGTTADAGDHYDQTHRLWGSGIESRNGFTLMQAGARGLLHAPPLKNGEDKPAKLTLRHYVAYDDAGQAYVAQSRLVSLV